MVSLQCVDTRGYKYWRVVESRRVNGKPRPILIRHLGTAENVLAAFSRLDKLQSESRAPPSENLQEKGLGRSLRWLRSSRDGWKKKCQASKWELKIKTLALKRARQSNDHLRLKLKGQSEERVRLQRELEDAYSEIEKLRTDLKSREEELTAQKKRP